MPGTTVEEERENDLAVASARYTGELIDAYGTGKDRIPPRQLDAIIDKVGREGGDAATLEAQLSGWVRARAVHKATDHVDVSELGEELDSKFDEMMEGFNEHIDIGAEPEPEPEPFGQRTPQEGESIDRIASMYGAGEIDTATYEAERAKRGLEPMRA